MQYASFFRRFFSFLIDWTFLFILSAVFAPLGVLAIFFYAPVFNSSRLKGTPGKLLLNTIVVGENGETLSYKTALLRELAKILTFATFGLGHLMFFFTKKSQTLHDYLCRAVVLNAEIPQDNYFSAWWEKFKSLFNTK